jgi:hypothetical protein
MGMTKSILLAGVAGLLFSVMPASAHHAFAAEFDAKKGIKVTGTITKLALRQREGRKR